MGPKPKDEANLETLLSVHCLKKEKEGEASTEIQWTPDEWEQRWVEAARKGQTEAFERLVLTYQQKVFNLVFRLLGEREEAEDLTQEIFLNVFKHIKEFRGDSQFSTWLYQVTLNHCRNRLTYLRRRFHYSMESLDDPVQAEEGEVGRELPDEGEIPEDTLYRRQVRRLIQKALRLLRDEYREIVVLRDIQELSYQEIGQILGLPEGTIKSRLHRARWELKELLAKMGIERSE